MQTEPSAPTAPASGPPAPARRPVSTAPSELADRHSRADLAGQFVISPTFASIPEGWPARAMRSWVVGAHAWLPVATLRASDGVEIGWLLGFPIETSGRRIDGEVTLPVPSAATAEEFETALYRLGGRYVAVWLTPLAERVYLDAGGTLSAVYSPAHGMVAATPSLVPYSRGCDDDVELLRATRTPTGRAVLGFGLTSRRGVERLLPNHYLDLRSWTARRHWPHRPLDDPADPAEAIHVVADLLDRQVAAITRHGPAYMALTAGFDSRTLLACARAHLDRLRFITLAMPGRTGAIDVEVARQLARRHGLAHQVLDHLDPSDVELDAWLWRTGLSVSEPRGWRATRTYGQLDPLLPEIMGTGGEAARATYWRECGRGRRDLTAEVIAGVFGLPTTPEVLSRVWTWMHSYPATRAMHLVDGLYVEQRLGGWAGVVDYGDAVTVPRRFHPFVHRDALSVMLRLPDPHKLAWRFPADLIRSRWPDLMAIPVNRRSGLRHHVDRIRRRAWLARRALAGRRPPE